MARKRPVAESSNMMPMAAFVIAVAVLYFARQILIPFALALLCAFLLSPAVKRLESWYIPRIAAILLVMIAASAAIAGLGWVVTDQLVQIVNDLPEYRENIDHKMAAIRAPGSLSKLAKNVQDLGKELTTSPPSQPPLVTPRKPARSARAAAPLPLDASGPLKVEVIEPQPNALQSLRNFVGPLLGPLETAGIVIVFTLFMLIDREDLRNRLLSLIGQRQLHRTTKALDDAAQRVSRFLLMQFLVNTAFGALVALGLYFIGVQSFILWGVMALFLRFLPYVGVTVAGLLPLVLALATTEGWRSPVLVLALFLALELVTGNVVEPLVYGANTGLSSLAVLAAVVFWTAIWGPAGLILSTPLTVCLSVLGRYSPHLQFLDVLLGHEPALSKDALFYQRLLALDHHEALLVAESFLKDNSLTSLYDQVILGALAMAEQDRHAGQMDPRREEFVLQSIREIVTELAETDPSRKKRGGRAVLIEPEAAPMERRETRVFCFTARDAADEIASSMIAQVAERAGFPALAFPFVDSPADLIEGLSPQPGDIVCISSIPPLALTHARRMAEQIRETFPQIPLVIGLWCYPASSSRTLLALQQTTNSTVVTSLAAALSQFSAIPVTQ
jgi:predicted PurR-regulated permease PerM